jgi:hypothetical protein
MSRNLRFWKQWGYVDSPGISTRFLPDETPALVAEGGEQDLISRKEAIEALQLELGAQVGAYAEQVEREPDNILASNYLGGRVYQAEENILLIKALGNPPESEMQCEHTEWEPGGLAAFLEERMNWTVTHCPWCGESLAPGVPEPLNDAESECACQDMSQAFIGNHLPDCEFNPFISSAPTGLTEREIIEKVRARCLQTIGQLDKGASEFRVEEASDILAILESSSAPTPEREN